MNPPKRKSSAFGWRTSTYSLGNGECIEVASGMPHRVAVRDSRNPTGDVLVYTAVEWRKFLGGFKR